MENGLVIIIGGINVGKCKCFVINRLIKNDTFSLWINNRCIMDKWNVFV